MNNSNGGVVGHGMGSLEYLVNNINSSRAFTNDEGNILPHLRNVCAMVVTSESLSFQTVQDLFLIILNKELLPQTDDVLEQLNLLRSSVYEYDEKMMLEGKRQENVEGIGNETRDLNGLRRIL